MSAKKLSEFRYLVFADSSLQKELREITDRREFVDFMVERGRTRGFKFDAAEVEDALRDGRRACGSNDDSAERSTLR